MQGDEVKSCILKVEVGDVMKSAKDLLQVLGDGYVTIEENKNLSDANETILSWFDFGEDVRNFDWLVSHFDPKDQVALRNVYTLSLSSDRAVKVNQMVKMHSGHEEKKYYRCAFIKSDDQIILTMRDITIEVTDQIRREISRNVFDSLPIGVVVADKAHKVLLINGAAKRGYFDNQAPNESVYIGDIIECENTVSSKCGESEYCDNCSINQALKSIEYGMLDHQLVTATKRTKDGVLKTFRVTISKAIRGDSVDMLLTLQDITDQVTYETSLKAAQQEAEEANALKTAFLSNMSHEIRTPLNGIIGMIDLSKRLAKGEELLENLAIAKESSLNLLRIINSVLDLSKMEAGLFEIHKMPFNTDDFIGEVINENKFKIKSERVDLIRNYEVDHVIISDRLRLKQVVNNLLDNAIKFTDKGYIKIQYHVVPKDDIATLTVAIIDTGIGISEEFKEKMFQNFMQADGSFTRQKGGSGLGLSISHRIVEKLGGQLMYRKNVQGGSEFYFSIPVELLKDVRVTPRQDTMIENLGLSIEKPQNHQGNQVPKNIRILLVEDDVVNQKVISKKLTLDGYEVLIAGNGIEAIRALEQDPKIELVIMDIQMPEMNGLEAIELIRKQDRLKLLPVIALTALALPEEKETIQEYGFTGYISKPVQLDDLSEKIGHVFESSTHYMTSYDDPIEQRSYTALRTQMLHLLNMGSSGLENQLDQDLCDMCSILEREGLSELKDQLFALQLEIRKEPKEQVIMKLYDMIDTIDQVMVI